MPLRKYQNPIILVTIEFHAPQPSLTSKFCMNIVQFLKILPIWRNIHANVIAKSSHEEKHDKGHPKLVSKLLG